MTNDGGPAFPSVPTLVDMNPGEMIADGADGMTMLDYFAGQAMTGVIDAIGHEGMSPTPEYVSKRCYQLAAAMLDERERYK